VAPYEDYAAEPTRANASEFITRALEDNYDQIAKKDNYLKYIATRPRAQRVGIDAVRYAGAPLCYHLDECGMQKSVTLVRVGKRGVEKIEQLPLTPRRAMRHLTGPLARLTARPTDTEDYIWATLTDPTPLPDAMAQLRAAYPNAMRLDYLPQGEVAHPLDMTQAMRGKPFVELFQDFFTKMNGRPLTVEEIVAVKRLREEASKSE
jgi:exonuclease SbcD